MNQEMREKHRKNEEEMRERNADKEKGCICNKSSEDEGGRNILLHQHQRHKKKDEKEGEKEKGKEGSVREKQVHFA